MWLNQCFRKMSRKGSTKHTAAANALTLRTSPYALKSLLLALQSVGNSGFKGQPSWKGQGAKKEREGGGRERNRKGGRKARREGRKEGREERRQREPSLQLPSNIKWLLFTWGVLGQSVGFTEELQSFHCNNNQMKKFPASKVINCTSEIRKMQAYDKNITLMKLYAFYWFHYKIFPFLFLIQSNGMLTWFEIKYRKILVL